MSSYLQRLVRSVTQPSETVHPVLGSMYSAAKHVREPEGIPLSRDYAPSHPPNSEVSPAENAAVAVHWPSPPAPLIPGVEALSEPVAPSSTPATPFQLPTPAIAEEEKPEGVPQRVYAELMTEVLSRTAHPETPSLKAPLVPATAGMKRALPHLAEREADEIQIHIGRIEVTAVQQAPARPLLKPARKGQSLDEYLKRRDRRA